MRAVTMKNFHLPMPAALYSSLREAATRTGAPATDVARDAIKAWLREERRRTVQAELQAYADAVAGTADDFDPTLSATGADSLLRADPGADWRAEPGYPGSAPQSARAGTAKPAVRRVGKTVTGRRKKAVA